MEVQKMIIIFCTPNPCKVELEIPMKILFHNPPYTLWFSDPDAKY